MHFPLVKDGCLGTFGQAPSSTGNPARHDPRAAEQWLAPSTPGYSVECLGLPYPPMAQFSSVLIQQLILAFGTRKPASRLLGGESNFEMVSHLTLSPDGNRLAFVGAEVGRDAGPRVLNPRTSKSSTNQPRFQSVCRLRRA